MKRKFKDGKYNHHLKKIKQKIKLNIKKEVAWAILLTTGFWLAFFLGFNS
jgi:hypothetical protein